MCAGMGMQQRGAGSPEKQYNMSISYAKERESEREKILGVVTAIPEAGQSSRARKTSIFQGIRWNSGDNKKV